MGPAFPEAENRERLQRAREALRQAGLDGCVCVAPEHLYYIGGYDGHTYYWEQGLVFTSGDDEPTLIVRDVDIALVRETTWLRDIRPYHFGAIDPSEFIAEVVKEKGLAGKRIGTELRSVAMPGAYAASLAKALAPGTIEDATLVIGRLRWVKSPRELAYVREAAGYANAGLEAAVTKVRPGITEAQLAGEIEYAMRSRGGDYPATATMVASGPRVVAGHARPTDRAIGTGDLVHVEFAGVARRYHCVAMKTFSLGEPSSRARELYRAGRESLEAGVATVRVGGPVAEAEEASLQSLEKRGLAKYAVMRFGLGLSAAYPPTWGNNLNIIRESQETFRTNMVFYLHSWLEVPEDGLGIITGGSYLMTDRGPEELSNGSSELDVISP